MSLAQSLAMQLEQVSEDFILAVDILDAEAPSREALPLNKVVGKITRLFGRCLPPFLPVT